MRGRLVHHRQTLVVDGGNIIQEAHGIDVYS
jgi:hypothetical protein